MSSEKPTIEDQLKKLKELLQDGTRRCRECADKKADREQEKDRRRAEAEEDRKEIKGGLQEIREVMRASQDSCESEFQQREQGMSFCALKFLKGLIAPKHRLE